MIIIAIQKPYNISLQSEVIDATESKEITWNVTGDQQVAFEIKIIENQTSVIKFQSPKINSFSLSYVLPANSLDNGKEYQLQITVYDINGGYATSDNIIFQTSSKPTITANIPSIVNSQSYDFTATYSQSENVPINTWIFFLYDSNQNLIHKSDIQTSTIISYIYDSLQNGENYFVEFQATSKKGMLGTSGKIPFSVSYSQINYRIPLTAENYKNASIKLSWKPVSILGKTTCVPPTYIDHEKLDVQRCKVWFDEGFNIDGNFILKMWIENPVQKPLNPNGSEIIRYNSYPDYIDNLWVYNTPDNTEVKLKSSISNAQPSTFYKLWIYDSSKDIPVELPYVTQKEQPTQDSLWIYGNKPSENRHLLKMIGDNGYISIEYFDDKFHLYKFENNIKQLIQEELITSNKLFVIVQQKGESLSMIIQNV